MFLYSPCPSRYNTMQVYKMSVSICELSDARIKNYPSLMNYLQNLYQLMYLLTAIASNKLFITSSKWKGSWNRRQKGPQELYKSCSFISRIQATELMSSLTFHFVKNKTCNSFMKQEWLGTAILEDNELENTIFNWTICDCIDYWPLRLIPMEGYQPEVFSFYIVTSNALLSN